MAIHTQKSCLSPHCSVCRGQQRTRMDHSPHNRACLHRGDTECTVTMSGAEAGTQSRADSRAGRTLAPTSFLCPASIECSPVLRHDKVGAPKSLQKNKHSTCGSNVHKCAVRACSLRACPRPLSYTQPDGSSLIPSSEWTDQPGHSKPSRYHSQKAL